MKRSSLSLDFLELCCCGLSWNACSWVSVLLLNASQQVVTAVYFVRRNFSIFSDMDVVMLKYILPTIQIHPSKKNSLTKTLQGTVLLIVLVAEYTMYTAYGSATTTMNCSTSGVVGKAHEIRCSVAGTIADGLTSTRPDETEVAGCNRNNICVTIKGYDVPFANDTLYILTIKNLQEVDAGDWVCRDGSEGTLAAGCSLAIESPLSPPNGLSGGKIAGLVFQIIVVVAYIILVVTGLYYYIRRYNYEVLPVRTRKQNVGIFSGV